MLTPNFEKWWGNSRLFPVSSFQYPWLSVQLNWRFEVYVHSFHAAGFNYRAGKIVLNHCWVHKAKVDIANRMLLDSSRYGGPIFSSIGTLGPQLIHKT